jgi:hypothetical protein
MNGIGPSTSDAYKLNLTDAKKIGINAIIAAVGAGVAVLIDNVAQLNMGPYTALVAPIIIMGLNTLQKWMKSNVVTEDKKTDTK